LITLIVHPINTDAHPTVPPGWRWAVMVGEGPSGRARLDDMRRCAEARWCPTQSEAALEGEMVAVAVAKALRMCGVPVAGEARPLDFDPIPAGADTISIGA
jgi:hypothetical protein